MQVIKSKNSPASGFVKCLVPASEKTPHRAMIADRGYFKRTTEGFYKLEHFDLEDMFGRRPRPSITVDVTIKKNDSIAVHDEISITLFNKGRGIAKYYGFFGIFDNNVKISRVSDNLRNISQINGGNPMFAYSDDVSVLHHNGIGELCGSVCFYRIDPTKEISLRLKWYCENMSIKEKDFSFPPLVKVNEHG